MSISSRLSILTSDGLGPPTSDFDDKLDDSEHEGSQMSEILTKRTHQRSKSKQKVWETRLLTCTEVCHHQRRATSDFEGSEGDEESMGAVSKKKHQRPIIRAAIRRPTSSDFKGSEGDKGSTGAVSKKKTHRLVKIEAEVR